MVIATYVAILLVAVTSVGMAVIIDDYVNLYWHATFFERHEYVTRNTNASYMKAVGKPTAHLAPYRNYFIVLELMDSDRIPSWAITREFAMLGGLPQVYAETTTHPIAESLVDGVWDVAINVLGAVTKFYVPFTTSGMTFTRVLVTAGNVVAMPVVDHIVAIPVDGFITYNEDQELYESKLGTLVNWTTGTSIDGSHLRIHGLSGFSPFRFILLNPPSPDVVSSRLMLSKDDFLTHEVMEVSKEIFQAGPSVCPLSSIQRPALWSPIILMDRVFMITEAGVIESTQKGHWDLVFPLCVTSLYISTQPPPTPYSSLVRILAIGPGLQVRAATVEPDVFPTTFSELFDSTGSSLASHFGLGVSSLLVAATMTPLHPEKSIFLVHDKDHGTPHVYRLVQEDGNEWSELFVFSSRVPSASVNNDAAKFSLGGASIALRMFSGPYGTVTGVKQNGWSTIALSLSSMQFHRQPSGNLFVFGNAVLYSPDAGQSFYWLYTFEDGDNVHSFDSTDDGSYCIVSDQGITLYGSLGVTRLIKLSPPRPMLPFAVFFNHVEVLQRLSLDKDTGETFREEVDVQVQVSHDMIYSKDSCPYEFISFTASQEAEYTRTFFYYKGLPRRIYLQHSQRYTFVVHVKGGSKDISALQASVSTIDHTRIAASVYREIVATAKNVVFFHINITDQGELRKQQASGQNQIPALFSLKIGNPTHACRGTSTTTSSIEQHITVYTGCPQGLSMEFSHDEENLDQHCTIKHGVPCFYYVNEFKPVFFIKDSVTGVQSLYEGRYSLRIIGGGRTFENIRPYSEEEMLKYNPGTKPAGGNLVWASKDELGDNPVFTHDNNGVNWICNPGSPCSGVMPHFPESPDYYFKLRVTNVGPSVAKNESYCDFSAFFYVRLHGLPLDFITTITVTLATLGIGLGLISLMFVWLVLWPVLGMKYYRWIGLIVTESSVASNDVISEQLDTTTTSGKDASVGEGDIGIGRSIRESAIGSSPQLSAGIKSKHSATVTPRLYSAPVSFYRAWAAAAEEGAREAESAAAVIGASHHVDTTVLPSISPVFDSTHISRERSVYQETSVFPFVLDDSNEKKEK